MGFAREMTKRVSYHALAALRRTDVITADASPTKAPTDIKATLKELFRRWDKKASELGPKLTDKQLNRLLDYVNGRYKPLLGKDAGKETSRIKELMKARYEENIALIRSIPAEAKKRYEAVLYDAITAGDEAEVISRLKTIGGITERQARTIARDQTAKAVEAFNMARSQELGLEYYVWDTAHDERVSRGYGGHAHLEGRIFRYDKAEAIVDSYGHRGHPGQRVNCRCTSLGVFLKPGERIVRAKDGYGYEIAKV